MKAIFENKEIKIIAFETKSLKPYEPMFHSHGEILYVAEGNVTVTIDGNKTTLSGGELAVVFPYAIHSYEPQADARVKVVLFSAESMGEFGEVLISKIPHNPFFENAGALLPLINKVILYSADSDQLKLKVCGAYLKALIGELLLKLSLRDAPVADNHLVRSVMNYCSEHFARDIGVRDVCQNVFVSERYVTKIFSEKVGCTFREYINRLRISKAINLAETTHMKVTDIMYECGFKNQSTFNRVFLEETGLSPRDYRKSVK